MADDIHRKTRPTYYTPDRVEAARENIETFEWAASTRDEAVEAADAVLDRGLDELWAQITGQGIPRSADPGDGSARNRWTVDSRDPWQMTDGEVVLPTNDFAAYRESGRDDRGFFDPALADDSLLVNDRYPDKPADWGVDDGSGWTDERGDVGDPGTRFIPVAFWNHWGCWYGITDDIEALRDAYLYTRDPAYARAATVLLDRIADAYPEMDIAAYPDPPFYNSHGGTGQGRLVGSIWETNLVRTFVATYDAVFPGQDTKLVSVLAEQSGRYDDLPEKGSLGAIRRNIEERLVTELLQAVRAAEVRGNLGMHQSALAMAAVVMDEPDGFTEDALKFLFRAGGLRTTGGDRWDVSNGDYAAQLEKDWVVTGGGIGPALVDTIDRDGYGNEAAPNYNTIIQRALRRIADILDTYDRMDEVDVHATLYEHPKFRRVLAAHRDLILLGTYTPSIGDSGKTGNPEIKLDAASMRRGFERFGDPGFAQAASLLHDDSRDEKHGSIFDPDAGAIADRVERMSEASGPLDLNSTLLPAYGFATLRSGSDADAGDTRRALTMYFGRNSGDIQGSTTHTHQDALLVELYANALDLAPDLGYPEKTADWPKAVYWTKNTVSHNTVVVDERRQRPHRVGTPQLFGDDGQVGLAEVAAPAVYPETDCYRRTLAFIDIDESASYAVDVFRVDGGDRHDYSFHGPEGEVTAQGLRLEQQPTGTYAGPDISRPASGEVTKYDRQAGSGFNYLDAVERTADPDERFEVTWDVQDTWDVRDAHDPDVRLGVTLLGAYDEVAMADGEPPVNKPGNPKSLRYLLVRRQGHDITSTFTALLEPYTGSSRLVSVCRVPVRGPDGAEVEPFRARAIRVELDTGRTDYIVSTTDPTTRVTVAETVEVSGRFAVYAEQDDAPVYARLVDGTRLHSRRTDRTFFDRESRTVLSGEVVDFTRELLVANQLTLDVTEPRAEEAAKQVVGRHVFVDAADADGWNAVYEVQDVSTDGDRLVLNVGDATTVRGYQDSSRENAGYGYVVSTGAKARIPVDTTWCIGDDDGGVS